MDDFNINDICEEMFINYVINIYWLFLKIFVSFQGGIIKYIKKGDGNIKYLDDFILVGS